MKRVKILSGLFLMPLLISIPFSIPGKGYQTITFIGDEVNIGLGRGCPVETDPSIVTFEDGRIVVANTYNQKAVGINWADKWGNPWQHYVINPPWKKGNYPLVQESPRLIRRGDELFLFVVAAYLGEIGSSAYLYRSADRGKSFSLTKIVFDTDYQTHSWVGYPEMFVGANGNIHISLTVTSKDSQGNKFYALWYFHSEDGSSFSQVQFSQLEREMINGIFVETAGQLWLFFLASAGGSCVPLVSIYGMYSQDDGRSFSEPEKVLEYTGLRCQLDDGWVSELMSVAYDSDTTTIYLVFSARGIDGIAEIYEMHKSLQTGDPWSKPANIVQDPVHRHNFLPAVVVSQGNMAIAFLKAEAKNIYRSYITLVKTNEVGKAAIWVSTPLASVASGFTGHLSCLGVVVNVPFGHRLAVVSLDNDFFVVWPDFRNGVTDLYGRALSVL